MSRRTRLPGGGTNVTFVLRDRGDDAVELNGERVPGVQDSETVVVVGQPKFMNAGAEDLDGAGSEERTRGYIVVAAYSLEQLAAAGQYIRRGDKVTKIGTRARNLFVTNNPIGEAHAIGHFPGTAGEYIRINVSDRDPATVAEPTQGQG